MKDPKDRLKADEVAAKRGIVMPDPKTVKRAANKERKAARLEGKKPKYDVDMCGAKQTIVETTWTGGSVFAGEASTTSEWKAKQNRKRLERKKATKARHLAAAAAALAAAKEDK